VDLWKIGKLNHGEKISEAFGKIERETDWLQFVEDAKKVLQGSEYRFKESLRL
jgi:hypothetical protein